MRLHRAEYPTMPGTGNACVASALTAVSYRAMACYAAAFRRVFGRQPSREDLVASVVQPRQPEPADENQA